MKQQPPCKCLFQKEKQQIAQHQWSVGNNISDIFCLRNKQWKFSFKLLCTHIKMPLNKYPLN